MNWHIRSSRIACRWISLLWDMSCWCWVRWQGPVLRNQGWGTVSFRIWFCQNEPSADETWPFAVSLVFFSPLTISCLMSFLYFLHHSPGVIPVYLVNAVLKVVIDWNPDDSAIVEISIWGFFIYRSIASLMRYQFMNWLKFFLKWELMVCYILIISVSFLQYN